MNTFFLFSECNRWSNVFTMVELDSQKLQVFVEERFAAKVTDKIKACLSGAVGDDRVELYMARVEVNGTSGVSFIRDSGIRLGSPLYYFEDHLSMKQVNLTLFLTDNEHVYAVSTTHMKNLMQASSNKMYMSSQYPPGEELGQVVCYSSSPKPFTEACLIKIEEDKVENITATCPFVRNNISSIHKGRLLHKYEVAMITGVDTHTLGTVVGVSCECKDPLRGGAVISGAIACRAYGHGSFGGRGTSGSPIINMSLDGKNQILSSHIGRVHLQSKAGFLNEISISQRMDAVLNEFHGKIKTDLSLYPSQNSTAGSPQISMEQCIEETCSGAEAQSGQLPRYDFKYSGCGQENTPVPSTTTIRLHIDHGPPSVVVPQPVVTTNGSEPLVRGKNGDQEESAGGLIRDNGRLTKTLLPQTVVNKKPPRCRTSKPLTPGMNQQRNGESKPETKTLVGSIKHLRRKIERNLRRYTI